MSYLIEDLPVMLTKDVHDYIDVRRVEMALHRMGYNSKGEITRDQYVKLQKYFEERKLVDRQDAMEIVHIVGGAQVEKLLSKTYFWIDQLCCGRIRMTVREYRILNKYVKNNTLQIR